MDEYATRGEIRAVEELAGALFDETEKTENAADAKREATRQYERDEDDRIKATAKFAKETEKNNREAAEAAREEWRITRDSFADFFIDMEEDGGKAFDNLADSFEKAVKKMIAQWLASGLMGIFGMGGGGPNASGGFSLFGGGNGGRTGGGTTGLGTVGTLGSLGGFTSGLSTFAGLSSSTGNFLNGLFPGASQNLGLGQSAVFGPTQSGGNLATGFDFKTAGMNLAAGFAGSAAGNALGENLLGKQAESSLGATAGGTIGGMFLGPLGAFLGSTLGSFVDVAFGGDGYVRSNAGLLLGDTSHLDQSRLFGVDSFDSGLEVTGFNRRQDAGTTAGVINAFRGIDSALTELTLLAGGSLNLSGVNLAGVNQDGQLGTSGTFLGLGGKTQDFESQLDFFALQIADHITGLSPEIMAQLAGASSTQEISGILSGVILSNEELAVANFIAAIETEKAARTFHQVGNFIIDSNGDLVDANHEVVATEDEFADMLRAMPREMREEIEMSLLELKGIEEINGMLFNATGDLVDKNGEVIASVDNLARVLSLLPASMAASISQSLSSRGSAGGGSSAGTGKISGVDYDINGRLITRGQETLDALVLNPSMQGFVDFKDNNPYAFDQLGVTELLQAFEQTTGLLVGSGGLETYAGLQNAGIAAGVSFTTDDVGRAASSFRAETGLIDLSSANIFDNYLRVQDALGSDYTFQDYIDGTVSNLANAVDGSFATGLDRVPFDGFRAELHQGESIKTKAETDDEVRDLSNRRQELFTLNNIMAENILKMRRLMSEWNVTGLKIVDIT